MVKRHKRINYTVAAIEEIVSEIYMYIAITSKPYNLGNNCETSFVSLIFALKILLIFSNKLQR